MKQKKISASSPTVMENKKNKKLVRIEKRFIGKKMVYYVNPEFLSLFIDKHK